MRRCSIARVSTTPPLEIFTSMQAMTRWCSASLGSHWAPRPTSPNESPVWCWNERSHPGRAEYHMLENTALQYFYDEYHGRYLSWMITLLYSMPAHQV